MGLNADHGCMSILIITFVFSVGPLALLFGTDSSRPFDRRSL
jgi:hypothetical protein